jgi:hypothetical protein
VAASDLAQGSGLRVDDPMQDNGPRVDGLAQGNGPRVGGLAQGNGLPVLGEAAVMPLATLVLAEWPTHKPREAVQVSAAVVAASAAVVAAEAAGAVVAAAAEAAGADADQISPLSTTSFSWVICRTASASIASAIMAATELMSV